MKYYIISGEASGDLHASNLLSEIKKLDTYAVLRGWGGDLMKNKGVELVKHYSELAFMGFTEVLMNINTILKNIEFCKKDILAFNPDVVILVDYPGFNLRIAPFLKKRGIKVFYYISPQVWAWKESRVHKIKKFVDHMFVILPFEKTFYAKYNFDVDFVGHPLLDAVLNIKKDGNFLRNNNIADKPIVALLPGSRKQEIRQMLPIMLNVAAKFPDYRFVVAGAPALDKSFYSEISANSGLDIVFGNTYQLLLHSSAAMVTSGTATLETALLNVPEVVCYKGGRLSYLIAKSLVKIKYISLVNLILDRESVKELIQDELNENNLTMELKAILHNNERRNKMFSDYVLLKEKLGGSGASENTARLMYSYLTQGVD